jgi:hypothetical protein
VGDGAFTPEVWVRSASHPYHFFRFAFIFWYSRAAPKRQRTAVSTTPPPRLRVIIPSPAPLAEERIVLAFVMRA